MNGQQEDLRLWTDNQGAIWLYPVFMEVTEHFKLYILISQTTSIRLLPIRLYRHESTWLIEDQRA